MVAGEVTAEVGGQHLGGHGVNAGNGQRGVGAGARRGRVDHKVIEVQAVLHNLKKKLRCTREAAKKVPSLVVRPELFFAASRNLILMIDIYIYLD